MAGDKSVDAKAAKVRDGKPASLTQSTQGETQRIPLTAWHLYVIAPGVRPALYAPHFRSLGLSLRPFLLFLCALNGYSDVPYGT
jgi:hypothetical protein